MKLKILLSKLLFHISIYFYFFKIDVWKSEVMSQYRYQYIWNKINWTIEWRLLFHNPFLFLQNRCMKSMRLCLDRFTQLASYIRAIDYVPLSPLIDSHYPVNSSIALSLSALLPLLPLSTSNKHYPETGRPKQNANTYENLELSSRDLLSVIVDNAVTVHRAATRSRIDRTSTVTYISNPAQEGSANITKRWYQVFRE